MGSVIAMALFVLVGVVAVVTLGSVFRKVLGSLSPGQNRMQKDLYQLKSDVAPWFGDLVPWDADEMEKLSYNQINRKVKKGVGATGKGIFTSVYHEPMIAYAFKKYVGKKDDVLIYARTSHHEYAFRITDKETKVWMDSQPLGFLHPDGSLVNPSNQIIGKMSQNRSVKALPIAVNGQEVGTLLNPSMVGKVNPRAFEVVKRLDGEEEAVLLSLAILEMVRPEMG